MRYQGEASSKVHFGPIIVALKAKTELGTWFFGETCKLLVSLLSFNAHIKWNRSLKREGAEMT